MDATSVEIVVFRHGAMMGLNVLVHGDTGNVDDTRDALLQSRQRGCLLKDEGARYTHLCLFGKLHGDVVWLQF